MSSPRISRKSKKFRNGKLNYQPLEPRQVLAAIFPAYVDGTLSLGDPDSAAPYPLADTFNLETNPGASKTIYLDFNGHFSNNNRWNHSINFPAWNREGGVGSFSNAERIEIQKQFQNVAEDFAPFDVNVTTKNPGQAALIKSNSADQNYGVRVVNTQATDGFGDGIGGIAYLNSFDDNADNPVFVFNKGVNNGAMTISHEVGHAFGLRHDGLNGSEYHPGTGSGETAWGPILGAPFFSNLTQWSNGDYAGSTATQDDLAIITNSSNGINYKADDVGNTIATASLLETNGNDVFDWGIVERRSDVDYYQFSTGGGLVDLQVNAFGENPNLDIRLRVYRANGTLLLSNNPGESLDAIVQRNLASGTYYLAIDGVGKSGAYSDYGSLGFYSIEGKIPDQIAGQKIGEVGNIPQLAHLWKTVRLSQSYMNPVVVAGPATINGADPVTVRIRNVTANSFQIRLNEWDYRDDRHSFERVDWMVVESGTHVLTDGTTLRASKINSQNQNWTLRTFNGAFDGSAEAPIIFTSVTTVRDAAAVTTRVRNVTNSGFRLRIQEEQAADQTHAGEEVSWIAIERGVGQTGSSDFIVADTGRVVDHRSHRINFSPTFASRPSLFADMQTNYGGDNTTVRARNLVNSRAIIFLEEERSFDSEVQHTTESVGYLAIPQGDIRALAAGAAPAITVATPIGTELQAGRMIDGDLSNALQRMQSWGEVSLELAHNHNDNDGHGHGCGCGCGLCTGIQSAPVVNQPSFHAGENEISGRELEGAIGRIFSAPLKQQIGFLADHIRDSIGDEVDETEREFSDFYDSVQKHRLDSFFDQNLDLLSDWPKA